MEERHCNDAVKTYKSTGTPFLKNIYPFSGPSEHPSTDSTALSSLMQLGVKSAANPPQSIVLRKHLALWRGKRKHLLSYESESFSIIHTIYICREFLPHDRKRSLPPDRSLFHYGIPPMFSQCSCHRDSVNQTKSTYAMYARPISNCIRMFRREGPKINQNPQSGVNPKAFF